jgi:hypothetical protein
MVKIVEAIFSTANPAEIHKLWAGLAALLVSKQISNDSHKFYFFQFSLVSFEVKNVEYDAHGLFVTFIYPGAELT